MRDWLTTTSYVSNRKLRWIVGALVALIIPIVLFGCGDSVKEGYIIDKEFFPAHVEQEWDYCDMQIMTGFDSNGMPQYMCIGGYDDVFYSDEWKVQIDTCSPGTVDRSTCKTAWRSVTRERYDELKVEDFYAS